jgi:YggT family protein
MIILISLINFATNILMWILILHIILQFFLPPYHPIRESLSKIINPMLDPIRKYVPAIGMFDFSTMVLWLIIVFGRQILVGLLLNFV